jgi:hypothetical protein
LSLSVVSALARLGIDPWDEARRLSALSKDSAAAALDQLIAGCPGSNGSSWTEQELSHAW